MQDIESLQHIPVMLTEVIKLLNVKSDGIYVDCTLGRAGHSTVILSQLTSGKLYAFDQDQTAIDDCHKKLQEFKDKYEIIKSNFGNLTAELAKRNVSKVDGILYDLGISSPQVDEENRGFSYMKNAKLDMRMDQSQSLTAWDIVNNYSYQQLGAIIKNYGEESFAKVIAKNIVKARAVKSIDTTFELVAIIKSSLPHKVLNKHHHPAKKTFQALRIAVNKELDVLKSSLTQALHLLKPHGRVVVISFHSLEDRIVKQTFHQVLIDPEANLYKHLPIQKEWQAAYQLLTKKPLMPSISEINDNPRARSAKLRAITYLNS